MRRPPAPVPWARSCYAIDTDGDVVTAIQATRTRGGVTTRVFDPESSPPPVDDSTAIVATVLHTRESITHWISAPFASAGKAERVLPALLDIELPFPVEDCSCEFLARHRIETGGTRMLAVAARRTHIAQAIKRCEAAGGDPVTVDVEGLALWSQSLREHPLLASDDASSVQLLVYLGVHHHTLVIGRGGEYRSSHSLGDQPQRDILRLLRVQLGDATGPFDWRWTGPGALDEATVSAMRDAVASEWPGVYEMHRDPATFLPRAVATRALTPGPYRCNLRRGVLLHPRLAQHTRVQTIKAAALCLVAGLLLCAVNVAWRIGLSAHEQNMDKAFTGLASDLAGFPVSGKGPQVLKIVASAREAHSARLQPVTRLQAPSLTRTVQAIVQSAATHKLRIATASFRDANISVSGEAEQWSACRAFAADIEAEGYAITPTRRDESGDIVRFIFSITRLP